MHGRALGWRLIAVGPTVLLLLALTAVPVVVLLVMSLHEIRWEGGQANWTFLGLANYQELPRNPFYDVALRNTFVFVVSAVAVEMVLGFGLALMVSRLVRGRPVYLAIFLIPILVPGIVIGAIWKLMFNFDFGLFNDFVALLGLPRTDWLGDARFALASISRSVSFGEGRSSKFRTERARIPATRGESQPSPWATARTAVTNISEESCFKT
jgi:multiple sugar transport system permease protein